MLAYDFPVLGAFFTMLWFFLWIVWLFMLFRTIADVFRSSDLSGLAKVAWLLLLVVLPYLGVFIYVIARGTGMARRDQERQQATQAEFREYVRGATSTGSTSSADELVKLADLRDRGLLNDEEFQAQKAKILSA